MKKLLCSIITLSMCIGLVIPISVSAKEQEMTVMSENWIGVIEGLDATQHGGVYVEGDTLHVKPVESAETVEILIDSVESKTRSIDNKQIVVDDISQYTLQELLDAQDRIWSNSDNLDIDLTMVKQSLNSVIVRSEEWTDESKQAVLEAAGIDNIVFELTNKEKNANPRDSELNPISEAFPYAGREFYVGDPLGWDDDGRWTTTTLGACVKIGDQKGYITSTHGGGQDMPVSLNGPEIGIVDTIKYGGEADITFVKRVPTSVYDMTNIVRLFNGSTHRTGALNASGAPTEGVVVCFGTSTGYRLSIVESFSGRVNVQGKIFTNMMMLDNHGEYGDSGGPVMEDLGNGEYKLVGIYKGLENDDYGIATRWDTVERLLGAELY